MTATTRAREKWTGPDFGAAMCAYVEAHAKHARHRARGGRPVIESEAFHRDGDNLTGLVVFVDVGAWSDRNGDGGRASDFARVIAGVDLPTFMAQWGPSPGEPRPSTAPRAGLGFPPAGEVAALWQASVAVDLEPRSAAWLRSRRLNVEHIVDAGLLRALPSDTRAPSWARQAGRTWPDAFPVVTRLYDAAGVVRSLHARRTVDDDALSKTSSPARYTTRGLVMADDLGRALLAAGAAARAQVEHVSRTTTRPAVVLVEGLPAFAAWASDASDADEDAPAVIGILSGGWTAQHAVRVPDGARVLVDVDGDKAGDAYVTQIASTFAGRNVEILRVEAA